MNRKRIMVLGAGIMQIPALEAARRNGWLSLCVDGDPAAPGAQFADTFYPVDLKDRDALLHLAQRTRQDSGLDGVFTVGTDFSASVAWIAEHTGLPGISYQTALNATDKVRMRHCFEAAGVPSPRFQEFSAENPDASPNLGFPVVVKPVDNMGARGVVRINSPRDLPEAVRFALPFSRCGRVIVEEYIPGSEYSLDAVIYNGRITVTGFADRHIFFPPYFVELGHTLPTAASPEIRRAVIRVFKKGIRALGIDNGAAKGDIKWDGQKAVVGEIAARLSGGFMSGWTYPGASGYSSIVAAMRVAMGLKPERVPLFCRKHSAERAFISIPGRVKSLHLPETGSGFHFVRIHPGDQVRFPRNNVEKCGNAIYSGPQRNEVIRLAETWCASVLIRLDPDDDETLGFINRPRDWIPQPFGLISDTGNRFRALMEQAGEIDIDRCSGLSRPGALLCWEGWEREKGADWNGRSLADSIRLILKETGLIPGYGEPSTVDSWTRSVWIALFSGGIQGALWFIDKTAVRNHLS